MTITLDHMIVPARDKDASARFFARIFGLSYEGPQGPFAPVRVNPALTFDFDTHSVFETHHYAFHVGESEFDAILARVRGEGIPYGSDPAHLDNSQLNAWNGGRGVYFRDLDGHVLELMTRV
jgi:catechol 2,3-dioxygenase-like lactoylglutathione lyase family enzyme